MGKSITKETCWYNSNCGKGCKIDYNIDKNSTENEICNSLFRLGGLHLCDSKKKCNKRIDDKEYSFCVDFKKNIRKIYKYCNCPVLK